MMNDLLIPKVGPIGTAQPTEKGESARKSEGPSFDSILSGQLKGAELRTPAVPGGAIAPALKFSAHALDRLRDRDIPMSKELMGKLEKAVATAAAKGAKDSLVLTAEAAFIVSVKNNTVVTVVDRNSMNGNVFTNIDSTVIA